MKIHLAALLIFIVSILFTFETAHTQVTQLWASQLDNSQVDNPKSIAVDNAGNVYLTGYLEGISFYMTVKFNSLGVKQWDRYYRYGYGVQQAYSLALDSYGNVYVTGTSDGGSETGLDIVTIKYNTDGVQQWMQRYSSSSPSSDNGISIKVDSAGNSYVLGNNNIGIVLIKYNTDGVQQWLQNSAHSAKDLAFDASGNVYIIGATSSNGRSDYLTRKYNTDGVLQWAKSYNSPADSSDETSSIAVDNSGNVLVTGITWESGMYNCTTIKYNTMGVQQWLNKNIGAEGKGARGLIVRTDAAGNVYVTGTNKLTGNYYNTFLLKYSSAGDQQFTQTYIPNSDPTCMELDASGNIYITAQASIIKYNSSGIQQWVKTYTGSGTYPLIIYGLAIENSSKFETVGRSNGYMFTSKYSQTLTGVHDPGNIPESYSLSQNYPNPFNPTTNINYDIPSTGLVTLKVFDISGKEIESLVNQNQNAGSYSVSFNALNYPSGIYFYKLETNNFSETKKMILLK